MNQPQYVAQQLKSIRKNPEYKTNRNQRKRARKNDRKRLATRRSAS